MTYKAAIVGAGNMGTAISYGLAKLGYDLYLVDPDINNIKNCESKLLNLGIQPKELLADIDDIQKPDIVVSAATYKVNSYVAKQSIKKGIPYCDLGGDPDTSYKIQEIADLDWNEHKVSVFTDLGLAPGLVNIITENKVHEIGAKNVIMRVGGLPLESSNSLNYGLTWSIDGLRNEYKGACKVLSNGNFIEREALTDLDQLEFPNVGLLESFNTKGGMAHSLHAMSLYGVLNGSYKTMRYPGHATLINFLLNECKLDDKSFNHAILNACKKTNKDQVLIAIDIDEHKIRLRILSDDIWTAMQKATAFPTACVAAMIAEKLLPKKPRLDYMDIPMKLLLEKLIQIDPEFPLF